MKGLLFVITAPSGAGKSSLIAKLLADERGLTLSVSYTTRPPRPGEQDGREYHFVDAARVRGDARARRVPRKRAKCTATATAPRRR